MPRRPGWTDNILNFFLDWLAKVKSLVALACFLPGRAKDLSALSLSVALFRERTIPTERPPPVGEVSANFCG